MILGSPVLGLSRVTLTPSRGTTLGKNGHNSVSYSVLLPTYNEHENLPLMVYMLDDVFTKKYVSLGRFEGRFQVTLFYHRHGF
jgi:hypothetical protein